jgi:hypothetical protein
LVIRLLTSVARFPITIIAVDAEKMIALKDVDEVIFSDRQATLPLQIPVTPQVVSKGLSLFNTCRWSDYLSGVDKTHYPHNKKVRK